MTELFESIGRAETGRPGAKNDYPLVIPKGLLEHTA
jgi:hypothetical protein